MVQFIRFCALLAAIAVLSAGLATGCDSAPAPQAAAPRTAELTW